MTNLSQWARDEAARLRNGKTVGDSLPDKLEEMADALEAVPPLMGLKVFDDWFAAEYPALPRQSREYVVANRAFNAGSRICADLRQPPKGGDA